MSYDEKANVSIDADGNVLKCAKGAAAGECGYVKGAKICAKCGAVPMQMKMVPVSNISVKNVMGEDMEEGDIPEMSEDMVSRKKMKKKKGMRAPDAEMMMDEEEEDVVPAAGESNMAPDDESDEEMEDEDIMDEKEEDMMDEEDDEEMMDEEEEVMEDEEDMDEEDTEEEDEEMMGEEKGYGKKAMSEMEDEEDMSDEEEMDEEDEEDDSDEEEMGTKAFSPGDSHWDSVREHRIKSMGIRPSDIGSTGYVCALERKAYAGSTPVCDDCPGGCVAEKGMPGILHAEGLAEKMFNGVVVDSGYSQDADMFVVDVQTKDGSVKEVFIDGTSAEVMGFHKLDIADFEQKSFSPEYKLIDFTEAAEIAIKAFDGHVVAVEPDVFEGFDSYAVEIDGFDGKSYDVFVALDGEVLGYDRYEQDEAEAIEAEAAEIALKRAFSEDRRMELAKEGMALPDGSYPIVNESDLRNAIQAFGRAKDKEAAKRHIMKRARALGMESLIPANWVAGSSEKRDTPNDAEFLASLVEFQLLEDQIENN